MEKSVVAAGRSVRQIVPLNQEDTEPSQGAISCGASPCYASSDDDDIELIRLIIYGRH